MPWSVFLNAQQSIVSIAYIRALLYMPQPSGERSSSVAKHWRLALLDRRRYITCHQPNPTSLHGPFNADALR
jgi:hypothetical protein